MNKNRLFWKVIPCLLLLLQACQSYLTIEPENRKVSEGYFDTAQRVEQAVIGAYVDLRRALVANHAWLMYGEVRAGDLQVTGTHGGEVGAQRLNSDNLQVRQLSDWGYFYDVIGSANYVLELLQKSEAETLTAYYRNLFRGEALALKSFAYFYLARVWGDIPSVEQGNVGQRLGSEEAASLAADYAREAVGLLPWILLNEDEIESAALTRVRFNKTAATLLLAQTELWRGRNSDAYTAITQLYADQATGNWSSFGVSMGTDTRSSISTTPLSNQLVYIPLARLNELFPTGDTRRSRLFTVSQDRASLIVSDQTVLPLLKLEEIDLVMAEAAWRNGRLEEAIEFLVKVSAGATEDYSELTESEFADALLLERQRLLIGTGQRFFDLMRFGQVTRHVPALTESGVAQGASYWPLSPRSISDNQWNQRSYWAQ